MKRLFLLILFVFSFPAQSFSSAEIILEYFSTDEIKKAKASFQKIPEKELPYISTLNKQNPIDYIGDFKDMSDRELMIFPYAEKNRCFVVKQGEEIFGCGYFSYNQTDDDLNLEFLLSQNTLVLVSNPMVVALTIVDQVMEYTRLFTLNIHLIRIHTINSPRWRALQKNHEALRDFLKANEFIGGKEDLGITTLTKFSTLVFSQTDKI